MNVVAKNFFEYNTVDENGKVISPAENIVKFTKDKEVSEYNTIITAEKAAEFNLNKVFTNWKPADLASQTTATAATLGNDKLSWTGDAQMYLVAKDGKFFALTTEKSVNPQRREGNIHRTCSQPDGRFRCNNQFSKHRHPQHRRSYRCSSHQDRHLCSRRCQLSNLQKGINIIVKILADGSKKTSKVIVK